jgi:hypothetical protein
MLLKVAGIRTGAFFMAASYRSGSFTPHLSIMLFVTVKDALETMLFSIDIRIIDDRHVHDFPVRDILQEFPVLLRADDLEHDLILHIAEMTGIQFLRRDLAGILSR